MRHGRRFALGASCGLLALACGGETQHHGANSGTADAGTGGARQSSSGGAGSAGLLDDSGGAVTGDGAVTGGSAASAGAASRGDSGSAGASADGNGGVGEPGGASGAGGDAPLPSCDPIVFEDSVFEAAVRANIDAPLGPLGPADVAGLRFLTAAGVGSIRGAECLVNLTSLDIAGSPMGGVTDLSPLAGLSKLEEVDVGRNPLTSVAPLGDLPSLKLLFMSNVPTLLDLAPLSSAPALELLYLEGDTVVDLSPLGSVKTLTTLHVNDATLLWPAGTSQLTSLVDLSAPGVFDDATPLATLTKLKKLRLGHRALANLAALSNLRELGYLDVDQAELAELAPLAQLKNLRNLQAAGNRVQDLTPLRDLPLSYVVLIQNQITDVRPLADNQALAEGDFVWLSRNPFSCVDQAASLDALKARGVGVDSGCP